VGSGRPARCAAWIPGRPHPASHHRRRHLHRPGHQHAGRLLRIKQMDGTVVASTNLWSVYGKTGRFAAPGAGGLPATGVSTWLGGPVTDHERRPAEHDLPCGARSRGTNPGDFVLVGGASDTCTGANLAACVQPPGSRPLGVAALPGRRAARWTSSSSRPPRQSRERAVIATHSGASRTR
jgi:hypothetical protein